MGLQRSPLSNRARSAAAAVRSAASCPGAGRADPLWHSPRQVAQRAALKAAFGSTGAVVQRVPAGRYITTADGNLRDVGKMVIVPVKRGTEARVKSGAATETFKLPGFSLPKAHTWAHVLGHEGWLKDSLLGSAVPEVAPALDDVEVPRASAPISALPSRSRPIGVGARGGQTQAEPPATTSIVELDDHRLARSEQLQYPGIAPGAHPLGQGKPSTKDPADYHIQINGGQLFERTGQQVLTVGKSPFVLSTEGQLFGGQGQTHVLHERMARHGDAQVTFPAWAGEMGVSNGHVNYIDNESGTFKLRDQANINLIKFLYRRGVLDAQQVPQLDVRRVSSWGVDRGDSVLSPHDVLGT